MDRNKMQELRDKILKQIEHLILFQDISNKIKQKSPKPNFSSKSSTEGINIEQRLRED